MSETPTPPPRFSFTPLELMRIGRTVGFVALLGVVISIVSFGGLDGPHLLKTVVPFTMVGLTIALQRYGMLAGIVTGIAMAFIAVALFEGEMASWSWIGKFFISALKMIIAPLILFAMVTGITGLGDVRKLGRISRVAIIYFLSTSIAAVTLGSILVNLIQPGVGLDPGTLAVPDNVAAKEAIGFQDLALSFVSDNIIKSFAELDMLPIIVFSLVFGAVLTTLGDKGKPVLAFFEGGNAAMMKVVHVILMLAPVGVFALIAGRFGTAMERGADQFWAELGAVAGYSWTVLLGLFIHAVIVLPLIAAFIAKKSPFLIARKVSKALLTAFSTASSSATLPLTMKTTEEELGVDRRATQFVLPLGATINMDGTALYEAVAVIFIAQVLGIELSFGQQVLIVVTATLAAIGAAGIPEAGLVTMVMVLNAVNLPLAGVELILAVDWLLDRFRTTVNVWGDVIGTTVVERHGLEPAIVSAAAPGRPS